MVVLLARPGEPLLPVKHSLEQTRFVGWDRQFVDSSQVQLYGSFTEMLEFLGEYLPGVGSHQGPKAPNHSKDKHAKDLGLEMITHLLITVLLLLFGSLPFHLLLSLALPPQPQTLEHPQEASHHIHITHLNERLFR